MKNLFFVFFAAICISAYPQDSIRRARVGLVLSGGGAKGFAHVGALKVIEEAGIPIDYITGTSIGSIVGGLYAMGYDAATLSTIIGNQNWEALLSNESRRAFLPAITREEQSRYLISVPVKASKIAIPEGVLNGQKAMDLFTVLSYGFHDSTDFSRLPIPFKCIAADIASGAEVVLDSGYLPRAMRASMSVPAVFSAVETDNRLLVDGGIINNFPVDRCREMGADVIIGIDIGDDLLSRDRINTLPDMIAQLTTLMGFERSKMNSRNCDVLIRPDISGYSASSFSTAAAKILMERGEEAARKALPELVWLRDSLNLARVSKVSRKVPDQHAPIALSRIDVEGTEKANVMTVLGKMGLGKEKRTNLHEIREGVERLYATGNYQNVDYRITGGERKVVTIMVRESSTNRLNVGLNYNTDLKAAALINMTLYSNRISGSNFSVDAKLSIAPVFAARYSLDRGTKPGFITSASFMADKLWGYESGHKTSEISVQQTALMAGTQMVVSDIFRISLGTTFEYFHFNNVIGNVDSSLLRDDSFVSYFIRGSLDQFDNANFANRGWNLNTMLKLVTGNGWNLGDNKPCVLFGLSIKGAKELSGRVVLLPSLTSQFTMATPAPVFFRSYMGGFQKTNYFGNYIAFPGLRRMELGADNVAFGSLDLRIRMWKKIYTTLSSSAGMYNNRFAGDSSSQLLVGGALSLAYDSVIGPVELVFSTSNHDKRLVPYFSLGYAF